MALDPSISLGAKPVPMDMAAAAEKGLSLRLLQGQIPLQEQQLRQNEATLAATQASTANALAQNEAIKADASIKARAQAFNQWQTENSKRFIIEKEGKKNIDHNAFVRDAAEAGFYTEAQQVAAADIVQRRQEIAADTDLVTKGEKTQELQKTMMAHAANIVANMPSAQAQQTWDMLAEGSDKLYPGLKVVFGQYDPARVKALNVATMTPQQQEELKIQKEQLGLQKEQVAQAGAGGGTDVQARDPNSTVTKNDYQILAGQGIYPQAGLSSAQLRANPQYKNIFENSVVGAGTKAAAMSAQVEKKNEKTLIDSTIGALNDLKDASKYGKVGDLYAAIAANAANDPAAANVMNLLDQLKAKNPNLNIRQGRTALINALLTQSSIVGKQSQNLDEGSKPIFKPSAPAQAPASSTIKMVAPSGKAYDVPADRVNEAIEQRGFKRVK